MVEATEHKSQAFDALCEEFAQRTGTESKDWYLVFKARYGMCEVFKALKEVHGDGEVTTTLFTGCTAVDSIIAAGLNPCYAPIRHETLGMDAEALEVGEKTRAVLFQHSYGMISNETCALAANKAHQAGAILVEDSAHCVARLARDEEGQPLADVSVHSFGIEKTFSNLYFGGAIWVNPNMADTEAHDAIVTALSNLESLPNALDMATQRYHMHTRMLTHLPAHVSGILRSHLLRSGAYEPPVADLERLGNLPYDSYLPSEWIVEQILPMLRTLPEDEARRVACVERYRELLSAWRGDLVPDAAFAEAADQPLIRFPLVLPTEELSFEVRMELSSAGYYAVDWYRMPFYPGSLDISCYGVEEADVVAYQARYAGTIGLPTDIDPDLVDDVVATVCDAIGYGDELEDELESVTLNLDEGMDVELVEDAEEWNAIVERFGAHPMQQWQWGALKEATGPWTALRLTLSEGDEMVGGAQVLVRSMPFPFRAICYLPRGPFAVEDRLMDVANEVAEWCRTNTKAVSVKMDPAVEELDFGDGWEVSERVLINKTVVKDLTLDEDELMKSIPNRKCRQYIRKASRDGVEVRPGTEEDLPQIYAMYAQTAEADGFPIHEEEFYTQAFYLLEGSQQLFVAEQEGDLQAFLWNITSPEGTTFELWGAVTDTGKRSRANYYLKWCAMLAAKERGAVTYDLNGLLNDGISDFKLLFEREPTVWVETHDRPLSPLYYAMNKALEIRRHRNTRDNAQEDTSEK